MQNDRWIVVTSINPPTRAIHTIAKLREQGWSAVVVGDTKSPADWHCEGVTFLDVATQKQRYGELADLIPYRQYARKNLGYLYAIENGARVILETDDDNIPYESFGRSIERTVLGPRLTGAPWANIYPHFGSKALCWPRGLPLDHIRSLGKLERQATPAVCPIQQYLADGDPDVDAIYRLLYTETTTFDPTAEPIVLDRETWVPFNSQNTLFFAEAFPFLYLPCHVSFRMTDIWRSFVAQAALAHHGWSLAFRTATVVQERNEHNLMHDFADEVDGYLQNDKFRTQLLAAERRLPAGGSPADTVRHLWRALAAAELLPVAELPIAEQWLSRLGASHRSMAA